MADRTNYSIDMEQYKSRVDELTLFNDYLMRRFFSHAHEETEFVLSILLKRKIHVRDVREIRLKDVNTESVLKTLYEHEARLDIHAVDEDGRQYDIEFQADSGRACFRRARFYGSMLDTQSLKAGQNYSELPDIYVIFFTLGDCVGYQNSADVFSVFHHQRRVKADFGMYYVYVNCSLTDGTELDWRKHDFQCKDPDKMYCKKLGRRMKYIKSKIKEDPQMISIMEQFKQDGLIEGRKEGEEIGRKAGEEIGRKDGISEQKNYTILKMLTDEIDDVLISKYAQASEEEIQAVREQMKCRK